jgi:hypothetical protein
MFIPLFGLAFGMAYCLTRAFTLAQSISKQYSYMVLSFEFGPKSSILARICSLRNCHDRKHLAFVRLSNNGLVN